MKLFPILNAQILRAIPWGMIAPHEARVKNNHGGQSLEDLAELGGLSPWELLHVLEDNRPPFFHDPGYREKQWQDFHFKVELELLRLLTEWLTANPIKLSV